MPMMPPRHRPAGMLSREEAERRRKRLLDQRRPNAHDRGYDADWQRARAAYLAEHPMCCHPGCTEPASDVDHIESIRDRPDLRLEPSNFRSLCRSHHSARTARDQGFARGAGSAGPRGSLHPAWLRPSRVPLTIVCGPPASGKSGWVAARVRPKELVLDLDVLMARVSKLPLY